MKKKYAIVFVVSVFGALAVCGTMQTIQGKLPFEDTFLQLSAKVKGGLYLPIQEDHTVVSGTFDIDLDLQSSEKDTTGSVTEDIPPKSDLPKSDDYATPPVKAPVPEGNVELDLSDTTGYLIVGDRLMQICTIYEENFKIYADNLNRLKLQLPDTAVISMVVPNSFPFYAPKQYITADVNQEQMIENLYASLNLDIQTVDAYSALKNHETDYNYFRTDHHWTARGAYYAYSAFCETMGLGATALPANPSGVLENYIGATYKTLQQYPQAQAAQKNPDFIEYFVPDTAYTAYYYQDASMQNGQEMKVIQTNLSAVDDLYLVFLEGVRPVIHIQTEVKNEKSILIIKDSYANAFVPFLLAHYEDIYVIDYRNFNAPNLPEFNVVDFVKNNGIDEVMVMNYPYVPNDKAHSEHIGRMIP